MQALKEGAIRRAIGRAFAGSLATMALLLSTTAFAIDYKEAPELAKQVADGALPPVEERLPEIRWSSPRSKVSASMAAPGARRWSAAPIRCSSAPSVTPASCAGYPTGQA